MAHTGVQGSELKIAIQSIKRSTRFYMHTSLLDFLRLTSKIEAIRPLPFSSLAAKAKALG